MRNDYKLKVNSGGVKSLKLRRVALIIVGIFCYAVLVTSGTYAYLEMKKNTSVAGSAKCNGINYQGQEINASNISSTTNYLEGAKSTITLSHSEDCKIYSYVNIYLHVNDNITAPIDSVKALKYKIFQKDSLLSEGSIDNKGDSLLAIVPLTVDPVEYQVYLWIDSEISNGQYDNKSFSGYIYATSEQSSTINDANSIAITYDWNYLLNDAMSDYYDESYYKPCCTSNAASLLTYSTNYYNGTKLFKASINSIRGFYFESYKKLDIGSEYSYSFEAKASVGLTAFIGNEQGGLNYYDVGTSWKRYTHTFKATSKYHSDDYSSEYTAFIFYDWGSEDEERTLEVRNLQFQRGGLNNITLIGNKGSKIGKLLNATRNDYEFLGWYTDPIDGVRIDDNTILPDSDVTYYAHWKYIG